MNLQWHSLLIGIAIGVVVILILTTARLNSFRNLLEHIKGGSGSFKVIACMAALNVCIVTLGIVLTILYGDAGFFGKRLGDAALAASTLAVAFVSFAGTLSLAHEPGNGGSHKKLDDASVRLAVFVMVMTAYVTMVGMSMYFNKVDTGSVADQQSGPATSQQADGAKETQQLDERTKILIPNFTTVVSVVVASFFGSNAYMKATKTKANAQLKAADKETLKDDE